MHLRFAFVFFAATLLLVLEFSECLWMDHLCRNKREIDMNYENSTVIFRGIKKVIEHPDFAFRELCVYKENGEKRNFCMELGERILGDEYPKKLRIRRANKDDDDDDDSSFSFDEDESTSCKVPSGLKTAEIRCKLWPKSIKCKSYCVYGFTYPEGISRIASCTYKGNKWSKEFEECKPFIDCNVKLATPGSVKCIKNEIKNPPKCVIQCERHAEKDEIKSTSYACKSDGKWEPPLPFCVKQKGISTVRPPSEKLHKDIAYP